MSESGANVRDVVIAGRTVMREKRMVYVNEDALLAEVEELIRVDTEANASWLEIVASERGAFSELLEEGIGAGETCSAAMD